MLQGCFVQLIKELAAGTEASSVPVMTNVGIDISAKLPQMPFLLVAIQYSTKLDCCFNLIEKSQQNVNVSSGVCQSCEAGPTFH